MSTWVAIDFKLLFVGWNLDAGPFVNPIADIRKHIFQKVSVEMLWPDKREIEVFGKSVGLEKALLQAGATFEQPTLCEILVLVDACEDPAKDIILLNDVWRKGCLLGDGEDFAFFNHVVSSRAQRWGTRSRHLDTTRGPSCAGSSFAWPPLR